MGSEVEEPKSINRKVRKRKLENDNLAESSKKRKILRCADSSDEENVENSSVSTPKAERINKLQEMRKKIQAKKKVVYDSSNEESSEEDQEWLVEDEDKLPVWENEEAPPEEKLEEVDDEDLSDFIVEDDEHEDKPRIKKKSKVKQNEKVVDTEGLSEAEEKLEKSRKA